MTIHFCDLCNESVPQTDLEHGRAHMRRGRVVCASCERAMSHHPGAAPAPEPVHAPRAGVPQELPGGDPGASAADRRGVGSAALWVIAAAFLFAAGSIYVLDGRLREQGERLAHLGASSARLESDLGGLAGQQEQNAEAHRALAAGLRQRNEAQLGRFERLESELDSIGFARRALEDQLASLRAGLSEIERRGGEDGFDIDRRVAELSARIARGEDERHMLLERLAGLEIGTLAAAVPADVAPAPSEPAWKARLPDLTSKNESLRWEAIDALGRSGDAAAAEHIVPLLRDENLFVRMAAARGLGELRVRWAAAALIDALEDPETAVRENAYVALRAVSGRDLPFDPRAGEGERAKRVRAWREWWKKEGESAAPAGS